MVKKELSLNQIKELLLTLKTRFNAHLERHSHIEWIKVENILVTQPEKLWSLNEMEITGGEPDVVGFDKAKNEYKFYDCSEESPKGRRSLCYDRKAWESRKEHKPVNTAIEMAESMGIELLNEEEYRELLTLGHFDMKTSSWLKTPSEIRILGGAIFGDFRYDHVFIYHNGADSYYASRGFRGVLII